MVWLEYFDYTFYAALFCILLGYSTYPFLRDGYQIGRYSKLLFAYVFGTAILGFVVSFFGPILVVLIRGGDTVLPIFASIFIAPPCAIVGLVAFWVYVFAHRRGT